MRTLLSKIVFRFVECERTMRLLSLSMDDGIGIPQRLAIRLHCFCCPGCTNYRLQLPWLRSSLQEAQDKMDFERIETFSGEEKDRLNRLLRAAGEETPGGE